MIKKNNFKKGNGLKIERKSNNLNKITTKVNLTRIKTNTTYNIGNSDYLRIINYA